jgi:hypothetical protein
MTALRGLGIGVGDTEAPKGKALEGLHAARVFILFVVVPLRVQHAVDHQMRKTPRERPARATGLFAQDRYAEHDVGLKAGAWLARQMNPGAGGA